ncbi:MAG TPA: phosphoribosylformylglycinamidine synthase I [Elusimicrobiota bacterium]|nr:phosphoribosylformylglycinamidine synthase I [Elusimicrobiota bacterium]
MIVRALVIRCAGTNCDEETAWSLEEAGAQPDRVHVNRLVRGEKKLQDYDIVVIPGGFSYGDDIASGKVLANQLLNRLRSPLEEFVKSGRPLLGICNGFQVLVKCGLLPGLDGEDFRIRVTLAENDSGRFECRWSYLKVASRRCPFVKGLPSVFPLPVAHGEGKFVPESSSFLTALEKRGQVVFKYADAHGRLAGYPWNPNGSVGHVAGLCNPAGNVLGLMPHPERHAFPHQHSHWTRLSRQPEHGVGFQIFKNMVRHAMEWKERN